MCWHLSVRRRARTSTPEHLTVQGWGYPTGERWKTGAQFKDFPERNLRSNNLSLLPSSRSPQAPAATLDCFSEPPRPHRQEQAVAVTGLSPPPIQSLLQLLPSSSHLLLVSISASAVYQAKHSAGEKQSQFSVCCSDNPMKQKTPLGQEGAASWRDIPALSWLSHAACWPGSVPA